MSVATATILRRALLAFYRRHRRDLPWRRTRDPYAVWIAEVMLQQTQVTTVVPRFERFLRRFPDVHALAAAGVEQVCEEWAGLGYYRRARDLHAAARRLVDGEGGAIPADPRRLQRLPGVGRYTAGAIASIAFGVAAPIVDANVARVLSRVFALTDPPASAAGRRRLWQLAEELATGDSPGDLNQALMELGAMVCLPREPYCSRCPLVRWCEARRTGRQHRFPAKPAARPKRRLELAFAWIETRGGLWLERRPLEGLWAGLWQPPGEEGPRARNRLAGRVCAELGRPLVRVVHELTHRRVEARLYLPSPRPQLHRSNRRRPHADPLGAPLSAVARKIIEASPLFEARRI